MELQHLQPAEVQPGDRIICDGGWWPVTEVVPHAPGSHPASPIADDVTAWEIRTGRCVRWAGPQHRIHVQRG